MAFGIVAFADALFDFLERKVTLGEQKVFAKIRECATSSLSSSWSRRRRRRCRRRRRRRDVVVVIVGVGTIIGVAPGS